MSYKFQLGNAIMSGSLTQEGDGASGVALELSGGVDALTDEGCQQHLSASGDLRGYALDLDSTANVLTKTTLGSTVVGSSLTSVGVLAGGSIASGFGAIDNGTSDITTGGKLTIDVAGTGIDAAGALTMGAAQEGAVYADATGLVLDAKTAKLIDFSVAGVKQAHIDVDGIDLITGNEYLINNASVLNATTLGGAVVNSSLTQVGTIGTGVWQGTAVADGYVANDLTIVAGTVNNTPIGATTPSSAEFTTFSGSGVMQQAGNASFVGTLSVTGAVSGAVGGTFGQLTADGGLTMQSKTIISSARALGNITSYSGSSTLYAAGAATFSNTLAITGAATFNSTIDPAGVAAKVMDVADLQADAFFIRDNDNAGLMKKINIDDLVALMADGTTIVSTNGVLSAAGAGDNITTTAAVTNTTLTAGLNYVVTAMTGALHVFLPAVAAAQDGDIIIMKGNSGTSPANQLKVTPQAGDKIDGTANQSILLESPFAAVQLVYVDAATDWQIV